MQQCSPLPQRSPIRLDSCHFLPRVYPPYRKTLSQAPQKIAAPARQWWDGHPEIVEAEQGLPLPPDRAWWAPKRCSPSLAHYAQQVASQVLDRCGRGRLMSLAGRYGRQLVGLPVPSVAGSWQDQPCPADRVASRHPGEHRWRDSLAATVSSPVQLRPVAPSRCLAATARLRSWLSPQASVPE